MADSAAPPANGNESGSARGGRNGRGRGRGGGGRAQDRERNGEEHRDSADRPRGSNRGRGRGRGGNNRPQNQSHNDAAASQPVNDPSSEPTAANMMAPGKARMLGANLTVAAAPDGQVQDGEDGDVEADVCFICASPVVHNSVAPCNHRTCHICSLRLRALYKTKACAHCRVSSFISNSVVFYIATTDATPPRPKPRQSSLPTTLSSVTRTLPLPTLQRSTPT